MSCLSRLFLGVGAQGSWLWSGGMFTDFFLDDVVFFVAEVSLGSPICSNVWLECFFFDPVFRKLIVWLKELGLKENLDCRILILCSVFFLCSEEPLS